MDDAVSTAVVNWCWDCFVLCGFQ